MAWTPISGVIPQYQTSTGALASGYYLKFYKSGTTTAFSMATDGAGGTTIDKAQLDSSGYPTTDGSTRFIPHVDQKYKIVLYKNATDADANTTGNADWVIDAIDQVQVDTTDAWVLFSGTPTQTSATSFTLTGDQTSTFTAGTRIKADDSSTLYGIVTASAYTSLTTVTVTLDSGSLSGSLSAVYRGLSTTSGQEISAETIIFNARQTGSVNVNLKDRLSNVVSVKDYGAVGDGVTDDTEALESLASTLTSSTTVDFGDGTYLISKSGTPASPYGHRIFDITGLDNITFKANRATIKTVDHDIATNGGLSFVWAKGCNNFKAYGFDFDMTFTGLHTSNTQYPFCGGFLGIDDVTGSQSQDDLNGDWLLEDNTFKLYHPYGQYAQSGSSYLGDANNGFKIFPIFVSGDSSASSYDNQNTTITIRNNKLLDGHNGYGFWVWAWNDVIFEGNRAESFVGKQSNAAGSVSGRGIPMIRYHQFYCSGCKVISNYFRAKPCSERTTSGFEGDAKFVNFSNNLAGDYSNGGIIISGNTIIDGRGDSANSFDDWMLNLVGYGSVTVTDNIFDSTTETTNAYGSIGIFNNPESVGGQGKQSLIISNNNWSERCDYQDNISINNGATTAANRRLKQLVITGNTTLGQALYFITMSSTATHYGVQDLRVTDNIISGEFNTLYDKTNANSRAMNIKSSLSTDIIDVSRNIIRDKHTAILTNIVSATQMTADYNVKTGVTTEWSGTVPLIKERGTGVPTVAAANGSTFERTDGGSGTTFYVREAGSWVAK